MLNLFQICRTIFLLPLVISQPQNDTFQKVEITQDFRDSFSSKAATIRTIQADFKQEKYLSYLSATVVSEGLFYYRKQGTIRWEFTNPYNFVIIIKEAKLFLHDPTGEINFKEKENEFFGQLNKLVQNSLIGNVFSEKQYELSLMENEQKYKLLVVPKDKQIKSLIESVNIFLDKSSLTVESLRIFEPSGDYTAIAFSNTMYNKTIDDKFFE